MGCHSIGRLFGPFAPNQNVLGLVNRDGPFATFPSAAYSMYIAAEKEQDYVKKSHSLRQ